jgi:distribution and morphology protein 31
MNGISRGPSIAHNLCAVQTYDALAYHVTQANMNRRIKTVTLWSMQQTTMAALRALRTAVEPLATQMQM